MYLIYLSLDSENNSNIIQSLTKLWVDSKGGLITLNSLLQIVLFFINYPQVVERFATEGIEMDSQFVVDDSSIVF